MKMNADYRATSIKDIATLARAMREADKREVLAASGMTPREALIKSIDASESCLTGLFHGELVCVFGVASHPGEDRDGWGVPWMLGTDLIDRYPQAFARASRIVFRFMSPSYKALEQYVHAENTVSLRWLEWLGFEIHPAQPYGVAGEDFHRVIWTRN